MLLDPASSWSTASASLLPSAASAGVRAMENTTVMIRIWLSSSGNSFNCSRATRVDVVCVGGCGHVRNQVGVM